MACTFRQDGTVVVKFNFLIEYGDRPAMGVLNLTPFLCTFHIRVECPPRIPREQGSTTSIRELFDIARGPPLSVNFIPTVWVPRSKLLPDRLQLPSQLTFFSFHFLRPLWIRICVRQAYWIDEKATT